MPAQPSLLSRFRQTLAQESLVLPNSRVVIALSGGPDSVVLTHLLWRLRREMRLTLLAAHVDHQLRKDSAADAEFVESWCRRLAIVCVVERADVARLSAESGWSIEDAARRARYAFFQKAVLRHSADCVALAHTADDQAETVLLRLIRGSGITGLGAMAWKRPLEAAAAKRPGVWVVRPLLSEWRRDVLAYAKQENLAFRMDSSNLDKRFLRNRVRHELIPLLEKDYNANIKERLVVLAEQSRRDAELLDEQTEKVWKRCARYRQGVVRIQVAAFKRQSSALQRRLIRRTIEAVQGDLIGFEFRHWLEIEALFESQPDGSRVSLPSGLRLVREGKAVRCWSETAHLPVLPLQAAAPAGSSLTQN